MNKKSDSRFFSTPLEQMQDMPDRTKYEAFGIVEVLGQCMATVAIDQMVKSADVTYCSMITKYGGLIAVIMCGSVSAVHAAVEAVSGYLGDTVKKTLVLSNPSDETIRIVENEIRLRNGR